MYFHTTTASNDCITTISNFGTVPNSLDRWCPWAAHYQGCCCQQRRRGAGNNASGRRFYIWLFDLVIVDPITHPVNTNHATTNQLNYFFRFEKQRIVGFCHHKLFALLRSNGSHGFSHFVFEVAFYTLAVRASDHPQHSRDRRHWSSDWKLCGDATSRAVFFTQRSDLFTGFAYGHVTRRLDLKRSSWNFGRCVFCFLSVAYLVILKMYMICFSNKICLGCTCNTSTAYIYNYMYMHVYVYVYIYVQKYTQIFT